MTGESITVAIVIPAFIETEETLHWLDLCLASCEASGADEIVLWDDGSPIGIRSVTNKYDVAVLHDEHIGKSHARNGAVDAMHSKLLYPLDADDEILPDAITILKEQWDGVPLYSDIYKLHGTSRQYYQLLPFHCDSVVEKGGASVNVLHSKEQWADVGGWNEYLNLFEDWEYNSRLFWMYCGRKLNTALVVYRQHTEQTTKTSGNVLKASARNAVAQYLKDFIDRRNGMGCCGKRKSGTAGQNRGGVQVNSFAQQVGAVSQPPKKLDLAMTLDLNPLGDPGPGNVWAKYIGAQGMGLHDRRGMNTRRTYARVEYGGVYAVAAQDAVSEEAFNNGTSNCGFIIMRQVKFDSTPPPAPKPTIVVPKEAPVAEVVRTPVSQVTRAPIVPTEVTNWNEVLPNMSVRELMEVLPKLEMNDLEAILAAERATGHERVSVIKLVEKQLKRIGG